MLGNLGYIAGRAGDLKDTKARFEKSLAITRHAKDNPTSTKAQLNLIVSLAKLGYVSSDRKLFSGAFRLIHLTAAQ